MTIYSFDLVKGIARGGKYVRRVWDPNRYGRGRGGWRHIYRHEGDHHRRKYQAARAPSKPKPEESAQLSLLDRLTAPEPEPAPVAPPEGFALTPPAAPPAAPPPAGMDLPTPEAVQSMGYYARAELAKRIRASRSKSAAMARMLVEAEGANRKIDQYLIAQAKLMEGGAASALDVRMRLEKRYGLSLAEASKLALDAYEQYVAPILDRKYRATGVHHGDPTLGVLQEDVLRAEGLLWSTEEIRARVAAKREARRQARDLPLEALDAKHAELAAKHQEAKEAYKRMAMRPNAGPFRRAMEDARQVLEQFDREVASRRYREAQAPPAAPAPPEPERAPLPPKPPGWERAGERATQWVTRVAFDMAASGKLPNLGTGYPKSYRALYAIRAIADRKRGMVRTATGEARPTIPLPRSKRDFWDSVYWYANTQMAEIAAAGDSPDVEKDPGASPPGWERMPDAEDDARDLTPEERAGAPPPKPAVPASPEKVKADAVIILSKLEDQALYRRIAGGEGYPLRQGLTGVSAEERAAFHVQLDNAEHSAVTSGLLTSSEAAAARAHVLEQLARIRTPAMGGHYLDQPPAAEPTPEPDPAASRREYTPEGRAALVEYWTRKRAEQGLPMPPRPPWAPPEAHAPLFAAGEKVQRTYGVDNDQVAAGTVWGVQWDDLLGWQYHVGEAGRRTWWPEATIDAVESAPAAPAPPAAEPEQAPTSEPAESPPGWERMPEAELTAVPVEDRIRKRVEAELRARWAIEDQQRAEGRGPLALLDKPPPGGWTEADKVRAQALARGSQIMAAERAKWLAENRAYELTTAVERELNKHRRFTVGQELRIAGKPYRVLQTDVEHAAKYANLGAKVRTIVLQPLGRQKKIRELLIWPSGRARLVDQTGGAKVELGEGKTIEGATLAEEPYVYPVKPTPTAPPTPPRVTPPVDAAPSGSPRAEAKAGLEASKEDYVNARQSAVPNVGEDILGSARHRALEWRSLEHALESDQAERLFTRKVLEAQHPPGFIDRVQKADNVSDILHTLFAHFALRKFPSELKVTERDLSRLWYAKDRAKEILGDAWQGQSWSEINEVPEERDRVRAALTKDFRQAYFRAYMKVVEALQKPGRSAAIDLSQSKSWPGELGDVIRPMFGEMSHADPTYETLRKFWNAAVSGARNKTGPLGMTAKFSRALMDELKVDPSAVGNVFAVSKLDVLEKVRARALAVLEGASIDKAFGTETKRGPRVDIANFYDTSVMTRRGPPTTFVTTEHALRMVGPEGPFKLRGVQWGQWVTDTEREHHLKSVADSMMDLTQLLSLPPEMASYNGRLGFAVGARGTAGALAHYEPDLKVINLTRASGAGSLAHEWAHFLDDMLNVVVGRKGFASGTWENKHDDKAFSPTHRALGELTDSAIWKSYAARVDRAWQALPIKSLEYWKEPTEMFARAFERYFQRKMHAQGRENTYLVALRKSAVGEGSFWPTDAEVEAMTPMFERLFATFRQGDLLTKMLDWIRTAELRKAV